MPRSSPLYTSRRVCLVGRAMRGVAAVPASLALAAFLFACDATDTYLRDLESGVFDRQLTAAAWFAEHPSGEALPALVGQLRSRDPVVRRACAEAILVGDDAPARAEARRTLRRDALSRDPDTATGAIEVFTAMGGEALTDLVEIAIATPDAMRRKVAVAIVREGVASADSSERVEATHRLLNAFEDTDPGRYRVAYSLLATLTEPLAPELIEHALRHRSMLVRRSVVIAAGEARVAAFAEPIAELLNSRDTALRKEAARALGDIGDPAATGPLRRLLTRESHYEVRYEARQALAKLGVE